MQVNINHNSMGYTIFTENMETLAAWFKEMVPHFLSVNTADYTTLTIYPTNPTEHDIMMRAGVSAINFDSAEIRRLIKGLRYLVGDSDEVPAQES